MKRYIKSYTNAYHGGNDWEEIAYDLEVDGEVGRYAAYHRDLPDGNGVTILPTYNPKSDFFGYKVMLEYGNLNTPPKKLEVFETFYDAMDFVDSGEMADMYL